MEENRIPKRVLYMNLGKQDWEVDQEIDGKMKWERMEEQLVEKGGKKKYITERNGGRSWKRHGIITFCTCQWNEWMCYTFFNLTLFKTILYM
jgi:hypothetical protein